MSLRREAAIVVAAPAQRVWDELTRFDAVQPFYFNSVVRGKLMPGGTFRYESPDGKLLYISGTTLEVDAPHRWVQEFQFAHLPEPPTRVTWMLTEVPQGTEIRVVHEGFESAGKTWQMVESGWPSILKNLKAHVETGSVPLGTRVGNTLMRMFAPLMFRKKS